MVKKKEEVTDKAKNEEAIIKCMLVDQHWRYSYITSKFTHREIWKIFSMENKELLTFEANTGGLVIENAERIAIFTANELVGLLEDGAEIRWKRIKSSSKLPYGGIRLYGKFRKYNNFVTLSCKERNHKVEHDTIFQFSGPGLDKTS